MRGNLIYFCFFFSDDEKGRLNKEYLYNEFYCYFLVLIMMVNDWVF